MSLAEIRRGTIDCSALLSGVDVDLRDDRGRLPTEWAVGFEAAGVFDANVTLAVEDISSGSPRAFDTPKTVTGDGSPKRVAGSITDDGPVSAVNVRPTAAASGAMVAYTVTARHGEHAAPAPASGGGSGGGPFASPVEFAAGSVSAPGVTFTTNTGSGLFHSTSGHETVSIAVDGQLAYEAKYTGTASISNFYGDTTTFAADTSTTLESPFVNLGPDSGGTRSQLRFRENSANGSNYIALRPPTSISANRTYTLPSDAQADGSLFTMNGSGLLSVTDPSALDFSNVPSGATQGAAGAAAGELWIDTSDGNALKVGT